MRPGIALVAPPCIRPRGARNAASHHFSAACSQMNAISLEGVTLRYRVPSERIQSFKEYAIRKLKRLVVFDEIEAVRDFDLTVAPGETLGVVGRNGAGKSTLFKLIARVLYPTRGRVIVIGRIAPLLELGLGLHGELTGTDTRLLHAALPAFSQSA